MNLTEDDVLVVEDDATINRLVCRYVNLAGFACRSALDGGAGLQEAMTRPPKLVLLDVMLPDKTGFEVCRELKNNPRTCQVPVILVTALADEESRRQGMQAGADAYLSKPVHPDQLLQAIKRHASRKTAA